MPKRQARTVAGRDHAACGFSPSNRALVEGDYGCLLVDPLPIVEFTEPVAEGYRRITVKPVRAMICTRVHPDHVGSVSAPGSEERVHAGGVENVALEELTRRLARDSELFAPVLTHRVLHTVYGCAR